MSDSGISILDRGDQSENALYALFFVVIALFLGENRAAFRLHWSLQADVQRTECR